MGMRQARTARRQLTSRFSALQEVPLKSSHFNVLQSGQKRSVKITEEPRYPDRPAPETRLSKTARVTAGATPDSSMCFIGRLDSPKRLSFGKAELMVCLRQKPWQGADDREWEVKPQRGTWILPGGLKRKAGCD